MLPRFFAPDAADDRTVGLPADEARHLTRVLRLGVGAEVAVFDGRGHEFAGRVERVSRGLVRVRIVAPREPAPEPAVPVTLVQAVLKGDRMDEVVRDAVMLGVSAIQPVTTEHGQVRAGAFARGSGPDRWRRVAIASSKQCRRAVVPPIGRPRPMADLVAETAGGDVTRVLLVEPGLAAACEARLPSVEPAPRAAVVAVGSEGGWSASEVAAAVAHGWRPVTLGRLTLRADAAPVAALAILRFCWRDL